MKYQMNFGVRGKLETISYSTDVFLNAKRTIETLGVVGLERCLTIRAESHKNPIADVKMHVPAVGVNVFLHCSLCFGKVTLK